jgi:DNA integrity scanning protein DisA with diadenylate cyclase activity
MAGRHSGNDLKTSVKFASEVQKQCRMLSTVTLHYTYMTVRKVSLTVARTQEILRITDQMRTAAPDYPLG